ncbi:MAG TPA: hypothetical protein VE242_09015 [Chthoniobacterales bacterium]|nr:hypothetical protein [Chthoniobacterales bacterium]
MAKYIPAEQASSDPPSWVANTPEKRANDGGAVADGVSQQSFLVKVSSD